MSDEIPFHIQEDIIKRLPVKSLVQFRCVSKSWKSLIDSSDFIAAHTVTQPQNLLLRYEDPVETSDKYVCFVDDETFPQQRFVHTLPMSVKLLKRSSIVGSSHGLLCLDGYYSEAEDSFPNLKAAVVWNPSIRKSIVVGIPKKDNEFYKSHHAIVGFGVCPITTDPIILEIAQPRMFKKGSETNDHWKVDVYKLSSGNWRSLSSNLPRKSIGVTKPQVVIDRFIYWSASNTTITDDQLETYNLIVSFDMSNENFIVVDLPEVLASQPLKELFITISKLRESLAVVDLRTDKDEYVFDVWMMENIVQKSFTKLFSIKTPLGSMLLGFRKSGKPIVEMGTGYTYDYSSEQRELVVYEPNSDQFDDLQIRGTTDSFFVDSYMETLLLLSRSDCTSYGHESRSKIMDALQRRTKNIPILEQANEVDIYKLFEVDTNLNASHVD